MNVVGYMHHRDIVLEEKQHIAIIANSHYVLAVGDRVTLLQCLEREQHMFEVEISFASNQYASKHQDQVLVKFLGDRASYQQFLEQRTVH